MPELAEADVAPLLVRLALVGRSREALETIARRHKLKFKKDDVPRQRVESALEAHVAELDTRRCRDLLVEVLVEEAVLRAGWSAARCGAWDDLRRLAGIEVAEPEDEDEIGEDPGDGA